MSLVCILEGDSWKHRGESIVRQIACHPYTYYSMILFPLYQYMSINAGLFLSVSKHYIRRDIASTNEHILQVSNNNS